MSEIIPMSKSLILASLLLLPLSTFGATINAASASRADVGTAVAAASNGDTVVIPAGTATWTSMLAVSKAITLQGAGKSSTVIQDGIASGALIEWTLVSNQNSRMTGIGFENNGRASTAFGGVVAVYGGYGSERMRVDNCRFSNLDGVSVFTIDTLGVIDSCNFENSSAKIFVYVYHENWGGYTFSDGSFADPPGFGQETWLFIESNTFAYTGSTFYAVTDAYRGARYVARYNTVTNAWWEAHGTDSGGRRRGTRAMEIYGNTHYYNAGGVHDYLVNFRSATGLIWSNTASGYSSTPKIQLAAYRLQGHFRPFEYANGDSPWDDNDSVGNPYVNGTATSGGTLTMTDSGKSWTTDQWVGYSIRNLTTGRSSLITGNTATTLTFMDAGAGGSFGNLSFSGGDSYRINLVQEVMDQPGKGQGTRLLGKTIVSQTHSGGTVTTTVTGHGFSTGDFIGVAETETNGAINGTFQITVIDANTFTYSVPGSSTVSFSGSATKVPAGWPDQVDEPIYEWGNTHSGSNIEISGESLQIRENEHFYRDTVYSYTPYTYPHPLRGESASRSPRGAPLRYLRIAP